MKKLEYNILASNILSRAVKEIVNYEMLHFDKFIGMDIFKVDGELKKKFEHDKITIKPKTRDGVFVHVTYYLEYKYRELNAKINVTVYGNGFNADDSACTTLYKTENGLLVKADTDRSYLDIIYNLEDLQKQADEIKEAEKVYNKLAEKFPYKFRHLFNIYMAQR